MADFASYPPDVAPKPTDRRVVRLGHRDRGPGDTVRGVVADIDDDAPEAPHHGGDSRQILEDALHAVERGSEAERALLSVLDLLVSRNAAGKGGDDGNGLNRSFVVKLASVVLGLIVLGQPTIDQVAQRYLSPSSALERKLDETLVSLASIGEQQASMQITFISLSKWVVDCELARDRGGACPLPPAPVRLLIVQSEMDDFNRTSGP